MFVMVGLGGPAAGSPGDRAPAAGPSAPRTSDTPSTFLRSARIAGVGVSMLVVAAWLWQIHVKRRFAGNGHPPAGG